MTVRIFISNNAEALRALSPSATVEAEYGDEVVEGSVVTLAHHGPRSANPAPCNTDVTVLGAGEHTIGISHVDLDTVGGVAALLGVKPEAPHFWKLAEFVDLNGPHAISDDDNEVAVARLNAYWAFSKDHRVFAPRDGTVADVTELVLEHVEAVSRIVAGDPELLEAGRLFAEAVAKLEKESFVKAELGVLLRRSDQFVNHLYAQGRAVVAFNTAQGSVTVSFFEPTDGLSAREIVQGLWGPEAGGHVGIAGSPRNRVMTMKDAEEAFGAVAAALDG